MFKAHGRFDEQFMTSQTVKKKDKQMGQIPDIFCVVEKSTAIKFSLGNHINGRGDSVWSLTSEWLYTASKLKQCGSSDVAWMFKSYTAIYSSLVGERDIAYTLIKV